MYVPRFNAMDDPDEIRRLVAAVGSAQLITIDDDGYPAATLLPVVWDGDRLIFHLARANEHWRRIRPGAPALAVVTGPEAYVSPAWYASKTEQQLRQLVSDLPGLPATRHQQRAELAVRRSQLQRRLFQEMGGGVALFVVCVVVWLTSGAQGQFWPIWVALVVLIPLLRNGWRLYGPSPQLDRVERELERRAHRGGRRRRR